MNGPSVKLMHAIAKLEGRPRNECASAVAFFCRRRKSSRLEKLGPENGRANLDAFAATLTDAGARADRNVLAVTSDSRGSGKLGPFGTELPKQIVEVGIAEQNLVGIAAGLASAGKIVYAVSPACFLTARSLEQIKNDVAYSDNPVKLIGISAGVSYGALGTTHHSLHDLAALRAVNNLDIVVPADNFEAREAVRAVAGQTRPVYVRFGKAPMIDLHGAQTKFEIGKAIALREGKDVAFVATGETVVHALLAAEELRSEGISASVLSMHTIKPLDADALLRGGATMPGGGDGGGAHDQWRIGRGVRGGFAGSRCVRAVQARGHSRRIYRHRRAGGYFSALRHQHGRPG